MKVARTEGRRAVSAGERHRPGSMGQSEFKCPANMDGGQLLLSLIVALFCKLGLTVS